MLTVILALAILALAIPAMIAVGAVLALLLPRRPIRGISMLAPMLVFASLTRCTGMLETIGIDSQQFLFDVAICGMGLIFFDRLAKWHG